MGSQNSGKQINWRVLDERTKMDNEYVNTGPTEAHYQKALERFTSRADISDRNKDLVTKYLRDSALGLTVKGKSKTRIGPARRLGYLRSLQMLADFSKKDLDMLTLEDMQLFIESLEAGGIRSRKRFFNGKGYFSDGAPLSQRYVVDIKTNIRRYYKYLLGNCRTYPPLVDWFDVSHGRKEVAALTEHDVQKMVDHSRSVRDRALVQVLFDGGFRLGELLNIRLQHVAFREVEKGEKCFFLRAPYSKTIPRTVVLPMPESTKWLTYWLNRHPAKPAIKADGAIDAADLRAQLFPMEKGQISTMFRKLGQAAIGRHVWPHLMRHTSATYWANKLPYFKFCKRFGWTMTSDMPRRYIDAAGIDEIDTVRIFRDATSGEKHKEDDKRRKLMDALRTALEDAA